MRRLAGSPDHGIRSVQLVIELSVLFLLLLVFVVVFVLELLVEFLVIEFLVVGFVVIVWIVELERFVQFGELELVDAEPKRARS